MIDERLIQQITNEVLKQLQQAPNYNKQEVVKQVTEDISSYEYKSKITVKNPNDIESLTQMRKSTPARVGVGKAGPRLRTSTLLSLRADHAIAKDAVFKDVDEEVLNKMNLLKFQSKCEDRNQHLTRPDLGRDFSNNTLNEIKSKCTNKPTVQIYLTDGLSSQAINANGEKVLLTLMEGLKAEGINVGTPFFVKYGRIPSMDVISEVLQPEVTCVLAGERPGLATADSMSAYIAFHANRQMPEAKRTVISNIHKQGLPAVEAGAQIVYVIKLMLEKKASGVDLVM